MGRYRKSMKDSLKEARLYGIEETTSYPPKAINKKKHDAYKDPKRGEHNILKREDDDPSVSDISKGLKIDKKTVKKVMGEKLDALISEGPNDQQIRTLKTVMEPMRGGKISPENGLKLIKMMDKFKKKEDLVDLFKADIPFVSALAAGRLIQNHGMSGRDVNKLKEEVELKELFGISSTAYHRNNTMKFLDKMGIKHETSGRNGLIIKGVPKDKQQDLLNKIKKEVGMYNIATKEELEEGYTDARTKAYREHRKKLESARQRREEKKAKLEKEGKMSDILITIDDIANAMKKDRNMKPFVDRFKKDAKKTLEPKKSLEKVLPDYIPGKDIAKILNMSEDFEEARKDIKINPASLKGNDSIRIQATSGMTTTKQVEREIPLQNKQKKLGLNLRRQQNGFIVKGSKTSIVQLLKGLEDKFMMGIVNPNSLPYTVHKEEVELDEKRIVLRPPINLIAKGKKPVKVKLDSKEYEMFMKKGYTRNEETINEFTKKDFDKNEDENKHTENGVAIVNKFGTSSEKKKMKDIQTRHNKEGSITIQDQQARDKMINKYYNKLESVNLDERMGPIRPRHYDVEVTIKNARDAEAVDEYISNNMTMGLEDYDNDGIITANGYTAGKVNFHGDDAGHIGMEIQKKFRGKVKVVGEAVEIAELKLAVESMFQAEDKRNTEKAFDDMIKDGGIDKKDYEKSKKMYKSGDLKGLRKHIYKLDTAPLEAVMDTIRQNDPKAFKTMYPKAKGGDYYSSISYDHRNEEYFTGARGLVEKLAGIELTEIDAKAVKSLEKKSKASGIALGILKQVFKRGMAAWGSGSRTGMDQTQWSHARVNSFIAKKPGTWGGADKDLAKQAKGS